MNKNIIIVAGAVLITVAALAGFFGGMQYQKRNANSNLYQGGNETFRQRAETIGQSGQNFRPTRGEVSSIDNNSITVKLSDGSTKIIILSGNTAFLKTARTSKEDLKVGETVNIIGSQNSDGSITAEDIQMNPLLNQNKMSK